METEVTAFNPWLEIWYQPRRTIRRIVRQDPSRNIILIAILLGISNTLERFSSRPTESQVDLIPLLFFAFVIGAIVGPIGVLISGALTGWVGRRLGGTASNEEARAAIAWSSLPEVLSLLLWIPQIGLLGGEVFATQSPRLAANPALGFVFLGIGLIGAVLGIWQFVLTLMTVSEVHEFSLWRAFLTVMVPAIVVLFPFFACYAYTINR